LLYQLCFEASVRDKVFSEDQQLVEYLIEFNKKQKTNDEGYVQKMVKGILWLKKQYFKDPNHRKKKSEDNSALNNFIRGLKSPEILDDSSDKVEKLPPSINKSLTDLQSTNHIMISYNKEQRGISFV
jgi:hypothetical protein